jgi:hypothetical protein
MRASEEPFWGSEDICPLEGWVNLQWSLKVCWNSMEDASTSSESGLSGLIAHDMV